MSNSGLVLVLYSFLLVNISNAVYTGRDDASWDLIRAVSMGAVSAVEKLLQVGECDINYINTEGDTALAVAVARNDLEMVQLLLRYGADVNVGVGLEQLIEDAEINQNRNMVDLLRGYMIVVSSVEPTTVVNSVSGMVSSLLYDSSLHGSTS